VVAEEVEEEGLGEGVDFGEGGAAFGPQGLRSVQHLRYPPLLRQRRQGSGRLLIFPRLRAGCAVFEATATRYRFASTEVSHLCRYATSIFVASGVTFAKFAGMIANSNPLKSSTIAEYPIEPILIMRMSPTLTLLRFNSAAFRSEMNLTSNQRKLSFVIFFPCNTGTPSST